MKVLVIDDEEDVRFVARMSLGRVGKMTVVEARSGEEGIACARSERPDCILLDMMMPGMDGAATFLALRQFEETASIPVVFLTANAQPSDIRYLENLGARGVVLKPFDPMKLPADLLALLA
jgi:two-component system OmpR family response regulator